MQFKQKIIDICLACAWGIILILLIGISAQASILLREDFNAIDNLKVDLHKECIGVRGEEGTIVIADGFAKIKDLGCSMNSCTGVSHLDSWTDYELTAKLKINEFKHAYSSVTFIMRARRCSWDRPICRGGRPGIGFDSANYLLLRPANKEYKMLPQDIELNEWHEIRIIALGPTVFYYYDSEKVKEDNTDILVSGGFAIIAEEADFWLDYVEVQELAPNSLLSRSKIATCWANLKR